MKIKHWKLSSSLQKAAYLLSKIEVAPTNELKLFRKKMTFAFLLSEESLKEMNTFAMCEYLKMNIVMAREDFLARIDKDLASIAEVEALEKQAHEESI